MASNLRNFGLTAIVAIAIGAMAAPVAQAEITFTGREGGNHVHTSFIGLQNGNYTLQATAGSLSVFCENAYFSMTSGTGKEKALTVKAASESKCPTGAPGDTADVRMNTCDYRYNVVKEIAEDEYEGTTDIHCTKPGDVIEIKVTILFPMQVVCTIKVEQQTGVGPIYYENVAGKPDILIQAKAENLKTITEQAKNDPLLCVVAKLGTHTTGKYFGETTLIGLNGKEDEITAEVSGN
jgi:hypothetical protein